MDYENMPRSTLVKLLREYDQANIESGQDGITLNYLGRTAPWQIIRQVKPKLHKIVKAYSIGSEEEQARNELWDGENLSTMVTLYKHRGQVDLILTDPPYNTGEDFRYNDKWDQDPNDPDLGDLVPKDDGSRHSKWLKFMTPRLWMMREMLSSNGVIAICIDHRELYRLGMLMDEIFKEENRIAIINWQKSFSPKNDSKHISTATEYVLVYAKDLQKAKTGLLPRDAKSDRFFNNHDNDPDGPWAGKDPTAQEARKNTVYGIQSPFTGRLHYPDFEHNFLNIPSEPNKHWTGMNRAEMKKNLEAWGSKYEEKDLGDNRGKALVLAKSTIKLIGYNPQEDEVVKAAIVKAYEIFSSGMPMPKLYFRDDRSGNKAVGRPRIKNYLKNVKQGKVALSYWADEDYADPIIIDNQSWGHAESGHSKSGFDELTAVVGSGHNFKTVKPLKLMKKIIQLWCRPEGLILDPFAGSGTTGHAVMELNKEVGTKRRFILIEQGNTEKGDHYARSLTAERLKRVVTGDWASGKQQQAQGGFRFIELKREQVDAAAVTALAREEMIDLLLTSYLDRNEKTKSYLRRLPAGSYQYLFGINPKNEGFFLIWNGPENASLLDREAFKKISAEAQQAGISSKYHVYASLAPYTGTNIEFYKIPDSVLEHIGFNQRADAYNNEKNELGEF
ncbi:site-specific DNA-methyltransferase [Enterobacter hormaechei]|uniref:site-specific DNA-methyltransferase n=1 Tax=Enterobacter roggenkampii TaxID=1812935 RepID=UPI0024477A80|nr:site-specific DNA-methyltransferase [Enterobacter roggenkampii]MDG9879361.1 site-specific DNA-methyltransferase [Enterobacter roggenkampii]